MRLCLLNGYWRMSFSIYRAEASIKLIHSASEND